MENIYHPQFVKDLFNRMSASYERMNFITSFGFSLRWRRQFIQPLKTNNQEIAILDLMTGMGETWNATRRKFPTAKLCGLDFSEGMMRHAKRKNEQRFNDEVLLLQQDVLQNELPDAHYDIVICAFGLKTFDATQLAVLARETKRVLKKGGQFSFIEVSKPGNALLCALYGFYLGKMIPLLGRLLLANPVEYRMLWHYTNKFGNARQAMEIFKNQGLMVHYHSCFYGCATGFYGQRKD